MVIPAALAATPPAPPVILSPSLPLPHATTTEKTPTLVISQASAASRVATYSATRLTFRAEVIEPLQPTDLFRVVTPVGTFQMSKDDFYVFFDNVAESTSYQTGGLYNYATVPRKAMRFLVDE